ncbi:Imm32 family immunity protein (plasmid) [Agrobacterium sp. rho-13.3]|uniref:Imm32 family immunity protein n=1 Tax=Agrobacterium sp. rho-13.3 TaxID=3072980 RepID=UPI002A0DCAF6|nr:hypothetical protein [Agrobacterium sp. rho-13.3]MDX8310148.1 hypothetical protein [Agrobacterium sp. rho-13.3]
MSEAAYEPKGENLATMIKLPSFAATATQVDCDESITLDELTLFATPETFRALGLFFINAALDLDLHSKDHIHLQDSIENFSTDEHCDIILVNKKIVTAN